MTMPTLYVLPEPTAAEVPLAARVVARLAPFCAHGVFGPGELHAATTLARQAGEWDPTVILLAALTLRAPAHGHICFDLMRHNPWPEVERGDTATLPPLVWPDEREAQRSLARSPLVTGLVDDYGQRQQVAVSSTAFVFDGRRLYTQRNWNLQLELAEALHTRLSAPIEQPPHPEVLRRGLATLFAESPPAPAATAAAASPAPAPSVAAADAAGAPAATLGGTAGAPGTFGAASEAPPGPPRLDRQRLACALAALRPLTVLTGGPGTGKTHTVLRLLALAFAVDARERLDHPERPALRVALAAPTGKAAARVRESLAAGQTADFCNRFDRAFGTSTDAAPPSAAFRAFVETLVPRTLHRVLGVRPGPVFSLRHDAANPLPWDLVVVDETSMVDFELFARFVRALPDHTRVVLLGDRHQLASVEAGSILADLCGEQSPEVVALSQGMQAALQALLPAGGLGPPGAVRPDAGRGATGIVEGDSVVALTESRRFGADSLLGAFVAAWLSPTFEEGRALAALEPWIREPPEDLDAPYAALVAHAVQGYGMLKDALNAEPPVPPPDTPPALAEGLAEIVHHRRALEALNAYRVLCAQRTGAMGVEAVNRAIGASWVRGERLIGTTALGGRDDSFWMGRPLLITRNDPATGLFNGDVGVVVIRRDAEGTPGVMVAFPGPDALPADSEAFNPELRLVRYVSPARLPPHETTFAMTIHKSQGSEFSRVALALGDRAGPLLTRELIYTGVTRARIEATLFVRVPILRRALRNRVQRASGLSALLRED